VTFEELAIVLSPLADAVGKLKAANKHALSCQMRTNEALTLMHTWMMDKEAEVAELKTRLARLEEIIERIDG
jgi:hypothetical protein